MLSKKEQKRFTGIRCVPIEATLATAKKWAANAGISRVADISGLDRIGLPVFVSIRPCSQSNPLTYGKGLLPIDAKVGAYMEAIEKSYAEPSSKNEVVTRWGTPKDVVGSDKRKDAILDFSPIIQKQALLDEPLLLAEAEEVESGEKGWIPAELVYFPAPNVGQSLFGSSTNGLASGNSVLEASVHALTEVIERDILSFEFLQSSSLRVNLNDITSQNIPSQLHDIIQQSLQTNLQFMARYVPNDYGLPFFSGYLYDQENLCEKYFSTGWGCHHHKDIAFIRAICEAAQSRAAVIHGAGNFNASEANDENHQVIRDRVEAMLSSQSQQIAYEDIPDLQSQDSLEEQWKLLLARVRQVTDMPVYRVTFTPPESELQIIRLVVPTLEHFKPNHMRIGPRFQAAMEAS